MPAQVVDNPAALEFFEQVLAVATQDELAEIGDDLRGKSEAMRAIVGDQPARLDNAGVRELLGWVFSTRRHVDKVLAFVTPEEFAAGLDDLLNGADALAVRYDRFRELFVDRPEAAADLPGELLHFLAPDRYWLWTRWIWDPDADTGALRLVTTDDVDLDAPSHGEGYLSVGEAMVMLEENGKAVGFTKMGEGLFGTDVFLASVYATYMYTVLQMRLSREFTKVMPPLPGLVRRLLGVNNSQVPPARRS